MTSIARLAVPCRGIEVKSDGFRVEAVVDGAEVRLWTRGEKDAAERYLGPFLEPPTWVGANQAVVDGEVIALDERGEPKVAPDDCETHAA